MWALFCSCAALFNAASCKNNTGLCCNNLIDQLLLSYQQVHLVNVLLCLMPVCSIHLVCMIPVLWEAMRIVQKLQALPASVRNVDMTSVPGEQMNCVVSIHVTLWWLDVTSNDQCLVMTNGPYFLSLWSLSFRHNDWYDKHQKCWFQTSLLLAATPRNHQGWWCDALLL